MIKLLSSLMLVVAVLFSQDNATPRQLFERAAHVEEHERDFEKALGLYREAGRMAEAKGDSAVAAEASIAVKRLEERAGKGTETGPTQDGVTRAVERRLHMLVMLLSSEAEFNLNIAKQIEDFGAAAIPILERALNAERIVDRDDLAGFRGNSHHAGRALGQIAHPAATEALMRGLKSPDPVIRAAVLQWPSVLKHRAIIDEALRSTDPVTVRLGVFALAYLDDPALADAMTRYLFQADEPQASSAAGWLGKNRPDVAAEILRGETELAGKPFRDLAEAYASSMIVPWFERVDTLLHAAERQKDPRNIEFILSRIGGSHPVLPELLRDRIERVALPLLRANAGQAEMRVVLEVLKRFGQSRTADAFAAMIQSETLAVEIKPDVINWMLKEIQKASDGDMPRAMKLATIVAESSPDSAYGAFAHAVGRPNVDKGQLEAAYREIPERLRLVFLRVALSHSRASAFLVQEGLKIIPLTDKSGSFRNEWAKALRRTASSGDPELISTADAALRHDDAHLSDAGSSALANIARKNPDKVLPFVEKLLVDVLPQSTNRLKEVFQPLPSGPILAKMEAEWSSASLARRNAYFELVHSLQTAGADALVFFVKHFSEVSESQREGAIKAFQNALYEPAMDLIGAALKDSSLGVRTAAREALFAFREHREALEEFQRWKTGDAEARASITELVKLLESPNRDVVIGAVRALGAIKAKAALPPLVKLLERNDGDVKAAVTEAIAKIGESKTGE